MTLTFQSAPAIAGGRSLSLFVICSCSRRFNPRPPLLAGDPRRAVALWQNHGCFNPRPPLLAGDPSGAWLAGIVRVWFQSAPAIAGGRSVAVAADRIHLVKFQSAPAIAGGRSSQNAIVSNRANCFNPRPPLLAGDPATQVVERDANDVSIRARHCWRAIPELSALVCGSTLSFNPRPPLLAGDPFVFLYCKLCLKCFNPRPPLLAGDPGGHRSPRDHPEVSIRARHCWRAILKLRAGATVLVVVSIRARHCWRAIHRQGRVIEDAAHVSIRARHCWRAIPCVAALHIA